MLIRERSIASFCKVMIEGCVGVLWVTDRHFWKVEVIDGMDRNRGGNGGILPYLVRLADQDSSTNETETDNARPENLCCPRLRKKLVRKVTRTDLFVNTKNAP